MVVLVQSVAKDNLPPEQKSKADFQDVFMCSNQGHPMDLFPKISVLQAKFSWLGNLEKLICPWKESVAGQYTIQRGFVVYNSLYILFFLSLIPPLKG